MKRLCLVIYSVAVCALMAGGCDNRQKDARYHLGIVQIAETPLLDDARRGVVDKLAEEGFIDGSTIRITYKNAQGDMSNIPLIIKDLISRRVDLIVTDSTPCMVAAAQLVKDIPVVFTVAFSPEQLGMKDAPKTLTGVYDPMTMGELIALIRQCLPGVKKLGIPFNPSEQNAVLAAQRVREECAKQGITLEEMNVFSSNDILQTMEALVLKEVGAIVISADNTMHTGMPTVAKVVEAHKVPLFVTEPGLVTSGACAGIGADFYEWGRQSGKIAARIIRGEKPEEIPIEKIAANVLCLNLTAAKAQGVTFPDEVMQKAGKIIR